MREPPLTELSGAARLARGFFNSLIRRIECTKPLAGDNVAISETDNGIVISVVDASKISGTVTYALNVCSNGVPTQIIVYGPPPEPPAEQA